MLKDAPGLFPRDPNPMGALPLLHEFADAKSSIEAQAGAIIRRLGAAIERSGEASLAVSGGRSPAPLFDRLSDADLDWARVHITLVDERVVAPTHAHSNERLVREHLLVRRAAAACFQGLASGADDAADQAERADEAARAIDLALLGMGEDGHTGSLFAAAPEFETATDLANEAHYALIHPPPETDPPLARISMTLAALLAADHLMLAISGAVKREVFERALLEPSSDLPISLLLAQLDGKDKLDVYWHP